MHIEHTLAITYGSLVSVGAIIADTIQVDPSTVIGGGGVGVLGWLSATVWRYLRNQEKLQESELKLIEAKLENIKDQKAHYASERLHWKDQSHWHELERERLEILVDEVRALRTPTDRYTPVEGIPIENDPDPAPVGRKSTKLR